MAAKRAGRVWWFCDWPGNGGYPVDLRQENKAVALSRKPKIITICPVF
jgi:hypothetical protein